jgi:ketosteroid isomerase-like protein
VPTDNLALLHDGYAAFAAGDLVRLGELFADGIIWHMPARNPMSGDYRGKQEVFALFGQLAEQTAGTGAVALVVGCKAGHCSDDQR